MIDQIYEFRSSTDVKEGMNIGKKYQEQINSNFKIVEKHNLKDNSLTTYTKN